MSADVQGARRRARALFARNLELVSEGRIEEWVALFAEDGTLEFPFPPPGAEARFTGHAALLEHMKHFPELLSVSFADLRFHDTVDPDLVIAEFSGSGKGVQTGLPWEQTFISVVHTRDGRITLFRDFWNPLVTMHALGVS